MKLKSIISQDTKLVKLQLIKFKTYKQNHNLEKHKHNTYEYIELHLKKWLQIISNYHFSNKMIFFVGLPVNTQKTCTKLLDQTNHIFIPKNTWVKGVFTNKISILKYIYQKVNSNFDGINQNQNLKVLLTIRKKPDLIVLFDIKNESMIFNEVVKLRVPIVAITTNSKINKNVLYSIVTNFRFFYKKPDNVCFSLLNSIIKT